MTRSDLPDPTPRIAVIGAGPAGLMAAEAAAGRGHAVDVFDAMPSVARKFLLAGKGGMNITHAEAYPDFLGRYGERCADLQPFIDAFPPDALRAWIHDLGIDTFVGSSGRVFPTDMKAAPLLRAWLHRLREQGVRFHPRHRWLGWTTDNELRFATPDGETSRHSPATILALGGGSWARLGSDGAWVTPLAERGVEIAPLRPANCGFDAGIQPGGWSRHFAEKFAGMPLKAVAARVGGSGDAMRRGEFLITTAGIEGGLVYALSAALRDAIDADGEAWLEVDLMPDRAAGKVAEEVSRPRGSRSLASHLDSRLGLKGVRTGLLREVLGAEGMASPAVLAAAIKCLRLRLVAPRPLDEAISSAGGVRFEALDRRLMLKRMPGVFCAGEMLDWEAPTGGYLLTACFATGRAAGTGAADWLAARDSGG